MRHEDCVHLLQRALPRLHMRWPGFRRVRRRVCKRIGRRLGELRLADGNGYRSYLETNSEEWDRLEGLCRVAANARAALTGAASAGCRRNRNRLDGA